MPDKPDDDPDDDTQPIRDRRRDGLATATFVDGCPQCDAVASAIRYGRRPTATYHVHDAHGDHTHAFPERDAWT